MSFAASQEEQLHFCFGGIAAELGGPQKQDLGVTEDTWSREKAAPQQGKGWAGKLWRRWQKE